MPVAELKMLDIESFLLFVLYGSFILYYLMRVKEERRRIGGSLHDDLPLKLILPKANQIVNTSQQTIKSIYPFVLTTPNPSLSQSQFPFSPLKQRPARQRFVPPRPIFLQHFKQSDIVYSKFSASLPLRPSAMNIYSIDKLKDLSRQDFILNVQKSDSYHSELSSLEFDSRFESGNLSIAARVEGVSCLLLHNDVNTSGYTNWFYFSVKNRKNEPSLEKFAIMNYGKAGWPLNNFPGIWVWSAGQWSRKCCNISCEANVNLYQNSKEYANFNTLSFEYQFQPFEQVFFAYAPPYTYTDLLKTLDQIQKQKMPYFHRKLAGTTLIGNRLEMLTIANFNIIKTGTELPVIVILARTHAGETVSSWIMHNLIKFLVSNSEEAQALRNTFIFKLFPMVNPDGVVHGNYRCSLIGRDLNRRWKNPSKDLYPEVYFIKNQIVDTHEKKQIKMILDLHGHTQKKKSFFYGCSDRTAPHRCRLFPYLSTKLSGLFQFGSCNFAIEKSKESTARITLYNLIRIPQIFTLQTSMFGMADHFLSSQVFKGIAETIVKAIEKFFKVSKGREQQKEKSKSEEKLEEIDDWEEQLMTNQGLLKVGCEPSDGSDSEPSVCNLQFEKINKMVLLNQQKSTLNASIKKKVIVRPQSSIKPTTTLKSQGYSIGLSREINEKMSESGLERLKDRKLSPSPPSRGISTTRRHHRNKNLLPPKLEYTRDIHSISRLKEFTSEYRPLRMINFQLLIDESNQRRSLTRETFDTGDLRMRHSNYHMFHKGRGLSRPPQFNKQSM